MHAASATSCAIRLDVAQRERDELRGRLETAQRDLERAREQERAGATKIVELERLVADAARSEVAAARAQSQLAATTEELAALRNELDGQRMRVATQGVDAERTAARYAAIETSARQAIDELKTARTDAQRLTRERDQALGRRRRRAGPRRRRRRRAVRDDAKKSRKIVTDDAVALTAAKLQRQVEELRAELQQEQDARKELEELLDAERREPGADHPGLRRAPRSAGRGRRGQAGPEAEEVPPGLGARRNSQQPTPNSQFAGRDALKRRGYSVCARPSAERADTRRAFPAASCAASRRTRAGPGLQRPVAEALPTR